MGCKNKLGVLIGLLAMGIVFSVPCMGQDIATGLEGHWTFDDFTNDVAKDSSGNNLDAVIDTGTPVPAAGKIGNGLFFDGSSDLTVPWKGVQGNAPRTISCWIKTTSVTEVGFVGWGSNNTGEKWHFRINDNAGNGVVGAIRTEFAGSQNVATTVVTDGRWHHVVSVFEGEFPQDVIHYVDGELDERSWVGAQDVVINTTEGDDVSLGSRIQGTRHDRIPGSMDDVRIYSRALSAEDVKALFELGNVVQNVAVRSFGSGSAAPGVPVNVTLTMPATTGVLTETIPDGWTADNISDGGTLSGSTITWNLTPSLTSVSYSAEPGAGASADTFTGSLNGLITDGDIKITTLQGQVGDFAFHADIGSVDAAGDAQLNGEEYSLLGSGTDIWGTADGMHFAFNELEGPFIMRGNAFVDAFESSSDWVKGGLMVRNNLTAGSSHGYILVRTDLQMTSQSRPSQDQSSITVRDLLIEQNGDMEIERRGKQILFFFLDDNGVRQEFGSIFLDDLEDPVYAGLAVTSHENGSLGELLFTNFELELIDLTGTRIITADKPSFGSVIHVNVNVFTRDVGSTAVTETPPAGWAVSNIQTSGGTASLNANGNIDWTLEGSGAFDLDYDVTIPASSTEPVIVGRFAGKVKNEDIGGDSEVQASGLLPKEILDQQDITSGLIAHWTFDEGSGDVAADSSGNGRNAEFFAGEPLWVDGIKGKALEFDGDDALFVFDWYGIEGNAPRSIMCWIKSTATNTHGILSWGLSSENGRKEHFRINDNAGNGTVGAIRTEIQGTFNIATTVVNDGEWHFIASVFPEGGQHVVDFQHFVDGLLEGRSGTNANGEVILVDTAASPDVSDQEFRIGMSVQGGSERFFPGIIDEVRIYDRGLTNAEIQAVFLADGGGATGVHDFMLY